MTILLDTNALVWFLAEPQNLGPKAKRDITSTANQVYVSDVAILESAIKIQKHKLPYKINFQKLEQRLAENDIKQLNFEPWPAHLFTQLPSLAWSGPFDRAHIALAVAYHMTLITSDYKVLASGIDGLRVMDARA